MLGIERGSGSMPSIRYYFPHVSAYFLEEL